MCPDQGFDQLLPVTTPGDEEHESSCPHQVAKQEDPGPHRQVVGAVRVVTINQWRRVLPEVIAEPAHQVG